MPGKAKNFMGLIKKTFTEFSEDDCLSMAAALAYYTVFSLPPLLVLVISIAGMFWDPATIQNSLEDEIRGMVGESGKEQIHTMIAEASAQKGKGWATAVGVIVLLVGATGAFAQLQHSLNKTWEVAPDPKQGGIVSMIMKRVLSLGMVLVMAFLLLVSLVLTTVLSAAGDTLGGLLPSGVSAVWPVIIHAVVSFLVIWLLFAAIFKFLPDARIGWRDVWIGAAITAILFMLGKMLIGLYLGTQAQGAGPVILILLWIYYSAAILLIGAEFTQVWARSYGKQIEPEKGAVRVVRKTAYTGQNSEPDTPPIRSRLAEPHEDNDRAKPTTEREHALASTSAPNQPSTAKKLLVPVCVGGVLWYWWSSRKASRHESY